MSTLLGCRFKRPVTAYICTYVGVAENVIRDGILHLIGLAGWLTAPQLTTAFFCGEYMATQTQLDTCLAIKIPGPFPRRLSETWQIISCPGRGLRQAIQICACMI